MEFKTLTGLDKSAANYIQNRTLDTFCRRQSSLFLNESDESDAGSSSETFGVSPSIVYTVLVVAFAYLSIPFSLMLVVVGLLGTSSM